jgi:uncharacterized protein YcbK (DUF882 family)
MEHTWKKGELKQLTKNFTTKEFECKCKLASCVNQKISKELVDKIQKAREEFGSSLIITSGYRCLEHNTAIGSRPTSQHVLGRGADLTCKDNDKLFEILEKYFLAIGDARISIGNRSNFIHVDTRSDKKRRWLY